MLRTNSPNGAAARACYATMLTLLVASLPVAAAADLRGGIEIGAKGVKATAVEIGKEPGKPTVKTVYSAASNTTIAAGVVKTGKFADDAIRDTAAEVGKFAKKLRDEIGIAPENLKITGSSGLPQASNRDALIKAVKDATGLSEMEFLTPCREVELAILGLIPVADRKNAVLVDVGSGNIKGGVLDPSNQAICFSVPLGSVTYADRVARDAPGQPFAQAAARLRPEALESPLAAQVRANPELAGRRLVYLSGGAVYALATLMHPESVGQERVTLSADDISDYVKRLGAGTKVPEPDLSSIASDEKRTAAEKEVRNVLDTFTPQNLVAGAETLVALSSALQFKDKTLIFDRTAVTAWLRGTLTPPPPMPTPPTPSPGAGAGQGVATSPAQVTTNSAPANANQAPAAESPASPTPDRREVLKPRTTPVYPSPQSPDPGPPPPESSPR
jgi:hypothetical protein